LTNNEDCGIIRYIRKVGNEMNEQFNLCPECNSDDFENKEFFFDGDELTVHIECNDCDYQWQEVWNFSYSIVPEPDEE